jgi:NAD-dependent DNA ligase/DNA polymerase/3'-5' exonuclease PolX
MKLRSSISFDQKELKESKYILNMNDKTNDISNVSKVISSTEQSIDKSKRLNELFLSALEELNDIHMRKGEPFRARAFKKAQETLLLKNDDIMDYSEMKGMTNIGDAILNKFKELQETGTLKLIERERNNPLQLFTQIYGIGPKKAQELIDKGILTIESLKENMNLLNDNQKLGIQYYEDINKRIPRCIIDDYKKIISEAIGELNDKHINFDIVGSYRRNAKSSGDIDIILSHTENDTSSFLKVLNKLNDMGIIIEFLTKGKSKSLTITKNDDDIARRVDFLYSPPSEYSFAKLYFTGSKGFNTVMRHRALQFGYTLNEHGIHKMEGKIKSFKIPMDFPSEKSIFDFFKMEYKEPYERHDGRAVVPLETISSEIPKEQDSEVDIKTNVPSTLKKDINPKLVNNPPMKSIQTSIKKKKQSPKAKTKKFKKKTELFVSKFRDEGIKYLNVLTEKELIKIVKEANDAFFNDVSILSDSEYDIIKEYVERTYPSNKEIKEIGAPVIERNKVKLPYYMGSMDKIKPDTDVIDKWKNKYSGPYVVSAKLDGVSGLYSTENGNGKLYTRGDGTTGQDISYFIPYLKLPNRENFTVRGEFIIDRHVFHEKYSKTFSNPRNFVSGIINSKTIDIEKIRDIEFVAYEIIKPDLKPQDQMKLLEELNIVNVLYEIHENISNELLSEILVNWRSNYKYESDGIIVTDDKIYERLNKNPPHSFAFKMVLSEQMAEAKVIDVIWNVSKNGLLKPKIQIEPITLGGAVIQFASAHNASTVVDMKLGIGAIVRIIRSGDVIPYIIDTITPAETIKMPEIDFVWNSTHVDIELSDKMNNKDMIHKNITGFFTGLGVDGLSSGNIARIISAGYNSVPKILEMNQDDFLKVEGFKEKMANKIYDSVKEKVHDADLVTIMSASNIFGHGFGDRKIKLIIDEYPDIMISTDSYDEKIATLSKVKGMADRTSINFVEKIPIMIQFLEDTKLKYKLETKKKITAPIFDTSHPLYDKNIVFTGVREKQLMQLLEIKYNVKLSSTVNKNTFAIITKSKDDESGKLTKARSLDIKIFEIYEFKEKYNLNI